MQSDELTKAPNARDPKPRIYVTLQVDSIEQYEEFIKTVKDFIESNDLTERSIRRLEFDGN